MKHKITKKSGWSSLLTTNYRLRTGFAIVETVIASAIIGVTLFGLLGAGQHYVKLARETNRAIQANFLIDEGAEAIRSMRDESYPQLITPLVVGTTYYLYWNTSSWRSTTTLQTVDRFTRSFLVYNVSRDANDKIVSSGGTNDPKTRKFKVRVSWTNIEGGTSVKEQQLYLTDFFSQQ